MFDLSAVSQAFTNMFAFAYVVFINGGWVLILFTTVYIAFRVYMNEIQGSFIGSNKQIFLHVKVDKNNLVSLRAVDTLFAQLHAVHTSFTWAETYLEGKVNLWLSFEIVSVGGKISYIIRTPDKYRHLLETSIYAQFPNAEIEEVEDYMKNLGHWTPESDWDLWGTEYLQQKDYAYPIRTYRDFEHPVAEEKILDPLASLLEALGRMDPHELFSVQIVIRPIADKEWQSHVKDVAKELKGEVSHKQSLFGSLTAPLDILGSKNIIQAALEQREVAHGEEGLELAPLFKLTDMERQIIKSVEEKASRVGYEVKMRNLYIAPKDKFDSTKKTSVIGAFRTLSGVLTNNLKPDVSHTWTNYNYKIFKKLEKPFTDYIINLKKHHMLEGFVNRSMWIGASPMIFNSEELATLFHFPLATVTVPPVEAIEVKKGQPPANLPIL